MMTARVAGRLAIAFVLDFVEIGRGDRALIDGLILVAVVQANVAPLAREPGLQRAFGAYDAPLPDELRRPVSVSAVANSLRLPYETVRRRIGQLAEEGLCLVTPAGVVVPQRVVSSPEHMVRAFAGYERLRVFYYRLRDLDLLPEFPAQSPTAEPDVLVRAILRLFADYFLRTVDAVTQNVDDLVGGLVLLGIFRANTEHIPDTVRGGEEPGQHISDSLRRPVSVTALADRLRLPRETVRRHVARLVEEGRCERVRGGLVISPRPLWLQVVAENLADLRRMFAALAQLGVLTAWDEARAGSD